MRTKPRVISLDQIRSIAPTSEFASRRRDATLMIDRHFAAERLREERSELVMPAGESGRLEVGT